MTVSSAKALARRAAASVLHQTGLSRLLNFTVGAPWRIITYHRVIVPNGIGYSIQPGMYVTPETFEAHCRYLSKNHNLISVGDLTDKLRNGGRIPRGTIVVTFDDGWLDTFQNAGPILKQSQIPATVFLPTSFIGTNQMFWTDELARSLTYLRNKRIEEKRSDRSSPFVTLNDEVFVAVQRALAAEPPKNFSVAVDTVIETLKRRDADQRTRISQMIADLAAEKGLLPPERSFMNWEEVRALAEQKIAFGSHSHRHLPLAELSHDEIANDLRESKEAFSSNGILPVPVFCYPGGYYNTRSQEALSSAGIFYAVTVERQNHLERHPALLGRISIHNDVTCSEALFAGRISGISIF